MVETSLRERSKARRRGAIQRAAFRLFAERGYDATTIADIAAAAEVAPRTIAGYFASKQDIALSRTSEAAEELTALMQARTAGESVTAVLRQWLTERMARMALLDQAEPLGEDGIRVLSHRMFQANPDLRALQATRLAPVVRAGAAAIADDIGGEADDPGPRIAATAIAAVLLEIADGPLDDRHDEAVAAALDFIEAGVGALRR